MNNLVEYFTMYSTDGNTFSILVIFFAFIAGILSSLSPCSLGILPLIIAYIGGYSKASNKKLLVQMISFSLGLSSLLSIIGIICALTGRAFTNFSSPIFILLFGSILIILGMNLVGLIDIQFPAIVKKIPQNKNGSLFIYPFLIGCVFALASSPCSTPILASIMAIATVSTNILFSILLLFAFALGQCIIIILFALFTSMIKHTKILVNFSSILIKASGILLIACGLAIFYAIFKNT